ncbi:MAG TPA: phBC6A51 family helix-turn-helix protein [Blastocatellia bacterium]|nr:phBC6A51 family helix-turn-helix protein [Blastocatellia bacterium]HMX25781.1 phBC6A51 family helix-turn-helix protein [Blastocatellia bacterium]HMZ19963.1 phBC6A51 family helix-turn-helix protein [Blastocatellia bacterium]HNG32771.1 phBC6A51 family helix-turn-helix protein [Blastocatellia bacterium]
MRDTELTAKQEKAIIALLDKPTIREAALSLNVGEATLWRWLQDPEFQRAYRAARRQVVEHSISELQAATSEAVATLKRNLTCGNQSVEVRAAQIILDQSVKAVELVDLAERVEDLEQLLIPRQEKKRA